MKSLNSFAFLMLAFFISSCSLKPYVPQPMKQMDSVMDKDTGFEWIKIDSTKKSNLVQYSYVHQGDSASNWVEMFKRSFNPTMKPDLKVFIAQKEQEVNAYDGFNSFSSESMDSDLRTYFIEYEIGKLNEIGMIIVFSEIDGIYFQSWQYRSKEKDKSRVSKWRKLIKSAETHIGRGFQDF